MKYNQKLDIKTITSFLSDMDLSYTNLKMPYGKHDCRVWTLQVDAEKHNFLLTACVNRGDLNEVSFDMLTKHGAMTHIHEEEIFNKIQELVNNS